MNGKNSLTGLQNGAAWVFWLMVVSLAAVVAFLGGRGDLGEIRLARAKPRIVATCPAQGLMFNDGKVRIVRAVLYENGAQGWQECEPNPHRETANSAQAAKRAGVLQAEAQRNAILEAKRATKSTVPKVVVSTNEVDVPLSWPE